MIRTIYFHGQLADELKTNQLELDVDTPRMLYCALNAMVDGFRQTTLRNKMVVVKRNGTDVEGVTADTFDMAFGDFKELHLIQDTEGAGAEVAIAAIAKGLAVSTLTATVIYIAASVVVGMVLGAIVAALAPSPKTSAGAEGPDERPSFLYNGAVNVVEQGYPVPLVYGIHTTGSVVISAGIDVAQLPPNVTVQETPANSGGTSQPANPPAAEWQWGN